MSARPLWAKSGHAPPPLPCQLAQLDFGQTRPNAAHSRSAGRRRRAESGPLSAARSVGRIPSPASDSPHQWGALAAGRAPNAASRSARPRHNQPTFAPPARKCDVGAVSQSGGPLPGCFPGRRRAACRRRWISAESTAALASASAGRGYERLCRSADRRPPAPRNHDGSFPQAAPPPVALPSHVPSRGDKQRHALC